MKLSRHVIYGLFDPNTHQMRYIGFTSNEIKRYNQHHHANKLRKNTHKNNWIRSLLSKNQKAEMYVLERYNNAKELLDAEIEQIEYYRSIGCDLVNETNGGEGSQGRQLSKESKEKISNALINNKNFLGHKHSNETRLKMSNSKKGKIISKETRDKISKTNKGKNNQCGLLRSKETKQKISQSLIGHLKSDETKQKMSFSHKGKTWEIVNGKRVWHVKKVD